MQIVKLGHDFFLELFFSRKREGNYRKKTSGGHLCYACAVGEVGTSTPFKHDLLLRTPLNALFRV